MKIKLIVCFWVLYVLGCTSKPIVSFSLKNVNGSALTCLNSEVPELLDLDKMILSKDQKTQCFLVQCRTENGFKVCTKEGNPSVLTDFKGQ